MSESAEQLWTAMTTRNTQELIERIRAANSYYCERYAERSVIETWRANPGNLCRMHFSPLDTSDTAEAWRDEMFQHGEDR